MRVLGVVWICVELCVCFASPDASQITKNFDPSVERVNLTWPMVSQIVKHLVDSVFSPGSFDFAKFSLKADLSKACREAALKTLVGLRNSEAFAVKMIDATGKIPSGVLEGTVIDFGSFDQCLRIKTNFSDTHEDFLGQFCMVGFKTPLLSPLDEKTKSGQTYVEAYGNHPEWIDDVLRKSEKFLKKISFWFGACVPSLCDREDVKKAVDLMSKPYGFTTTVLDCNKDLPLEWSSYQTAAVSFLLSIGGVVLVGTVLDVLFRLVPNKILRSFSTNVLVQALSSFSVYRNTEAFLTCSKNSGSLDFFNGIRFFSATWIILGHMCFFTDTWKYLKFRRLLGISDVFDGAFPFAAIENFTIPVGSFFFMSGFLITYTNWKKLEESKGKINILMFFIHKFWRITPAQIVTIALFFAMPLINSGPIWKSTLDPPTAACENTWWANIFFIQNWWNADDFCLLHTWYLAALMQFHMTGVLLLLLVYRYPLVGSVTNLAIFTGCTVLTGLLAAWHDFPMPAPGIVKDLDVIVEYVSLIYIKPYTHISTYIIGMIFGYLVLKYPSVKLSISFQVLGWTSATLCCLAVVYGIYVPSQRTGVRAVYISLHRIGWALWIGWLSFSCALGNAGIINKVLSWKVLAPLGQLSYLAYLLHPLVLWYRTASLRERMYFGYTELVYSFIGHTVVGFFLAYVCYVTVELPFATLENMLFSRLKTSTFSSDHPVKANGPSSVQTLSMKSSPEN